MEIRSVGIVGRGLIGSSWALVFARAGLEVRVWLRNEMDLKKALHEIDKARGAVIGTGLEGDEATLSRITFHSDLGTTLSGVDYIQESVLEDLRLKLFILRKIEEAASSQAVIGSSTSGFLPSRLSETMMHPERLLVVHPLTPPHLLPITEICAGNRTAPEVTRIATELMIRVGQHPVHLHKEIPGFALNRILGALMNECFALIKDGVISSKDVDSFFTEGFGLRWGVIGPLAAMDLNAPNGIVDYLTRYGAIYKEVSVSRGARPSLDAAVIATISSSIGEGVSNETRQTRAERRDRAIASFRQWRSR